MNRTNALFGLVVLTFITNAIVSFYLFQQIRGLKAQNTTPTTNTYDELLVPSQATQLTSTPSSYPTAAVIELNATPTPRKTTNYPAEIAPYVQLPIQQICIENSGYKIVYQLDDGTNIYTSPNGEYVRGRSVSCTNLE